MGLKRGRSKLISVGGDRYSYKKTKIVNFFGLIKLAFPKLPNPAHCSKSLELNGYIYNIGGSLELEITKNMEITNKVYRMNAKVSNMK